MRIESCRFVVSAFRAGDDPQAPGPDVVFLGRSNVGKSSLINRLLGAKGLARTSSTPGRTQSVNFFRINERLWFVDLPGYGYARVPQQVREQWRPMIEGVLTARQQRLAVAVHIVDARHDPTALDTTMRDWLVEQAPDAALLVATKADKLSGNARAKARRTLKKFAGNAYLVDPLLVSSTSGDGIAQLWRYLDDRLDSFDLKRTGEREMPGDS